MAGSKITSALYVSRSHQDANRSGSTAATRTATTTVTRMAVCLVVLLALLEVTNAQNVHFSNGWYPGKKRSYSPILSSGAAVPSLMAAQGSSSSGSPGSACGVRVDLGDIVYKLVMEEMVRLHNSCRFGLPRDMREILESVVCKPTKW